MSSGSRSKRTALAGAATVAAAVLTALAGCTQPAIPGSAGATPAAATPLGTELATPQEPVQEPSAQTTSAGTTTTSRTAPLGGSTSATCVKADLKVQSITTDYAMGTQGETVTVINRSGKPCALAGYAVLEYTTSGGTVARLPVTRPGTPGTSFEVRPGRLASFVVSSHPDLGGYDPTDPACAHPATYRGLSILFADKQRLALTGLTINVKCGDISLQPWVPQAS